MCTVKKLPVAAALLIYSAVSLCAQGETTSAITGNVTDPGGGAITGATVTIVNRDNGSRRSQQSGEGGRFSFPQLNPGPYIVSAQAPRFEPQQNTAVFAGLGQNQTVTFGLKLASSSQTITVTDAAPLINAENPNTATTLTRQTLETLPNGGGDLTWPVQFAPGALMNTAGSGNDFVGGTNGYGNVQFNGLSSLSNGYIVDGLETNDPLTNLNSGLATNLVLGLNSVAEMTVNTLSFAVDQGRYGASQVNYVTKSGTNQWHGNVYETWNGARFNAANFFTNALPGNRKPGSVVNHFGGSAGGPIRKNRLFFFFDAEFVRIALPIISTITVPTAALQTHILQQLPKGGTDAVTGSVYPPSPGSVPFYNKLFALYRDTSGTPLPVAGCPFNSDGTAAPGLPPNGNGCANRRTTSLSSLSTERVYTGRLDYNIDQNNTAWLRLQNDDGLQAAYTDPINPVFNALSPQPLYSAAAGYTHVFSPQLVNYFNPAFSWYESLFGPPDFKKTLEAFPVVLQGSGANAPFTTLGGLNDTWVQGRRAARYFVNDNLAWRVAAHELRFGTNTRFLRLNDYNFGQGTVPVVEYTTLPQLIYGVASTASRSFPVANNQPYNIVNADFYAQDTWKLTRRVTWTLGLRATHNSNPANPHGAVARLPASFGASSHDLNQPLRDAIRTGLTSVFAATPLLLWQPRTALAWQVRDRTVLRTGFGMFSDILPGSVVDLVGANPPYSRSFQGGLLGNVGGSLIAPGLPDSAVGAVVAADQSFQAGFARGELSCASPRSKPHSNPRTCLPPVAITAIPDGQLRAPYNMQWSFALEQAFGENFSLRAQYVGTHAVNQPYQTQENGYQTVCDGCFQPYPYAKPADARFGAVTQLNTGANSHYNALQLTVARQMSRGLQFTANYTWSHCLDTVSNGGFLPFAAGGILQPLPGQLARQYGPCDYDVRHNFTLQYVWQLPLHVRNSLAAYALNGWQASGSLFRRSGLPFSVLSTPYSANGKGIVQGGGPQYASLVQGVPVYTRESVAGATQPGTLQWLNPDAFLSAVDPGTGACTGGDSAKNCQFGNLGRNALRGPLFTSGDLYLTKWFRLNEHLRLRVDGQFFNVLNHPNFGLPVAGLAGIPGKRATQTGFGALTYTTAPPTGLLGVGLGGDSSPRLIAFQARLEF